MTTPQAALPRRRRLGKPRRRVRWPRVIALAIVALACVAGAVGIRRAGGTKAFLTDLAGRGLAFFLRQQGAAAGYRPDDPLTVLVMGSERAQGYTGQQTDSMMIWSFDPKQQKAAVLSVPRDLWVKIPGYGYQRINSAYEFGGYKTAALTVEKYIHVPIEYYAVVDYAAFVRLVDDLGGIDVNVPYNINDRCYPNIEETACTAFQLAKGPQHLDGATALKFARERHSLPQEDLSREADQQLVLFALKAALLNPRNLLHLPTIVADVSQLVTTNLPYNQLPQLALRVSRLPRQAIAHAVLDYASGAVSDYTTSGGADVLLPHDAAIRQVVTKIFGPVLSHMKEATIQVEDGAPTDQPLASDFSRILDAMGAHTLPDEQAAATDNADNQVYWNTAAAPHTPTPTLAYVVAHMLDTTVVDRSVPSTDAPIVVVLGQAFPKM